MFVENAQIRGEPEDEPTNENEGPIEHANDQE